MERIDLPDAADLPPEYNNFCCRQELVRWLLEQRAHLPH
jgi:hypothetical protein